jgi:hypothetical protein
LQAWFDRHADSFHAAGVAFRQDLPNLSRRSRERKLAFSLIASRHGPERVTRHPEVGETFWEISGFAGSIVALIGNITGYPGSEFS